MSCDQHVFVAIGVLHSLVCPIPAVYTHLIDRLYLTQPSVLVGSGELFSSANHVPLSSMLRYTYTHSTGAFNIIPNLPFNNRNRVEGKRRRFGLHRTGIIHDTEAVLCQEQVRHKRRTKRNGTTFLVLPCVTENSNFVRRCPTCCLRRNTRHSIPCAHNVWSAQSCRTRENAFTTISQVPFVVILDPELMSNDQQPLHAAYKRRILDRSLQARGSYRESK